MIHAQIIADSENQYYIIDTDDALTDAQLYSAGARHEGRYAENVVGPFESHESAENFMETL